MRIRLCEHALVLRTSGARAAARCADCGGSGGFAAAISFCIAKRYACAAFLRKSEQH